MMMKPTTTEQLSLVWGVTEAGVLTPVASKKPKKSEEEEAPQESDDWEKTETEEDNWDPDFDEFDVPKSRTAKSGGKKDEEEDLNFEEEELDLFDDEGFGEEGSSDDDY